MKDITYPGLYDEADAASNRQQMLFLLVIRAEFCALLAASILTINILPKTGYIILFGLVLIAATILLGIRSIFKLEQGWYQARALAESVKTATWKYVMGAKPFNKCPNDLSVRETFRNFLKDILSANQRIGSQFDGSGATKDQITIEMDEFRNLSRAERIALYIDGRIDNQRRWYAEKAKKNRTWAIRSIAALISLYALAFSVLLLRVAHPDWSYSHPEPLILLASALIGWMQIKKFNELATSYNLTAIEIGILKSKTSEIQTEEDLSNFVDDAEEAFSREHTQWLARRSTR